MSGFNSHLQQKLTLLIVNTNIVSRFLYFWKDKTYMHCFRISEWIICDERMYDMFKLEARVLPPNLR
jgi:hypothetical protein